MYNVARNQPAQEYNYCEEFYQFCSLYENLKEKIQNERAKYYPVVTSGNIKKKRRIMSNT
jgi:hypothetical protein